MCNFRRISSIVLSAFLAFSLTFQPVLSYARSTSVLNLPIPGAQVTQSPVFTPILLKGLTIDPEQPLMFEFIVDSGDTNASVSEIESESQRMVKYFLAALTVPYGDMWVNLSPYEQGRIIPDELGKTELGRDMLAQDYLLKQLTASLIDPQKDLGKKFWDGVYQKVQEKYGTTDVPVDTFNKVWILPEKATVYEHGNAVYVVESTLKVMLDEDYTALNAQAKKKMLPSDAEKVNSLSAQIVRDIVLPEIEREVNEGKNFTQLRQIYHSLILAKWYKETLKNSLMSQIYFNQNKIAGVDVEDKEIKDKIYGQYIAAYKKGVFNFIREDYDRLSGETIPRKYFSGGLERFGQFDLKRTSERAMLADRSTGRNYRLQVQADPVNRAMVSSENLESKWGPIEVARKMLEFMRGEVTETDIDHFLTTMQVTDLPKLQKLIDLANSRRFVIGQFAHREWIRPPISWIEDAALSPQIAEVLNELEQGKFAIEVIGGGKATRHETSVKSLNLEDVTDDDLKIWTLNPKRVFDKIKKSQTSGQDKDSDALKTSLKSKLSTEGLLDYSAGQRSLYAISKGIELFVNGDKDRAEKIRANVKIIIHVSDEIRKSVHDDLINFNFFGFNPENVILIDAGYAADFELKDGKFVPREGSRESWNHGVSFFQKDWKAGYVLDPTTRSQVLLLKPLHRFLREDRNVEKVLIRRINDGVLLDPRGGFDYEFLAAFLEHIKNKANVVVEVMKNQQGTKGGVALSTRKMSPYGFLIEGMNSKDKDGAIDKKLGDLKGDDAGLPYNRFYMGYVLTAVEGALHKDEDDFPMSLKLKGRYVSPEIPTGDLLMMDGIQAVMVMRRTDFLVDTNVLPPIPQYIPQEGMLNHDFKTAADFPMLGAIALASDRLYGDIKAFTDSLVPPSARQDSPAVNPENSSKLGDPAMMSRDVGGINLNEINVKKMGNRTAVKISPAQLQMILKDGVEGLTPVIINIVPIPSFLPMLGLEPAREEELKVSSAK